MAKKQQQQKNNSLKTTKRNQRGMNPQNSIG
jgi:hypothetical protein